MRVAAMLSGTGTTMSALLFHSRLPGCPYEVVLVASNVPDAPGLAIAAAEDVPTFALSHKGMNRADHDAAMDAALQEADVDYIAMCGYMRILTPAFVERWAGRMVNTHPSLLPKYKGLDTHARAIAAGDAHGGCSVHVVTPELDDGPVLGQMPVAILPGDTSDALGYRVRLAEYQLLPRVFADYVGRAYRAEWVVEQLRTLALAHPEAEERDSHGAIGWHTGGKSGKFFAYFDHHHHGSARLALLVKTDGPDELAALVERDPDIYFRPAYYGASGWVGIILNRPRVDWDHVAEWLDRSWRRVAPARLTRLQAAADQF
ncbi:phosphoribosylglycinamide formyltransferase [Croceibacterium sp. TMG7-5b_MA50]|uniref:phosphoribosylglycinamide formyltransferase n=1 Tax=Croceibacterium sp. TMG7-5b_MA50 TaxID=3121290 RepID=UPI003221C810